MKISTIFYFITSVPSENVPATFLEEVSLQSFQEVKQYLDSEEKTVRDSLVDEIIAKSKA